MADLRAAHTEPMLIQFAHVISGSPCQNCGSTPSRDHTAAYVVPTARSGEPAAYRSPPQELLDLDEVGEDEEWLWRLVDESDRVADAAPVAPTPERLGAAEAAYARAVEIEERIAYRIRAAERALASPASWLRPSYRAAIARELRNDRATAVLAAVRRSGAADVRERLRELSMKRADYLSAHRTTLSAGANARVELTRIIDGLIDGYAQLVPPPAWFRYGLGFPPQPGTYATWLAEARAAIAARRRHATTTID